MADLPIIVFRRPFPSMSYTRPARGFLRLVRARGIRARQKLENAMLTMPTSLKILPICACAILLGACAHRVTEREVIREQPIIQERTVQAPERVVIMQPPPAPQEDMSAAPAGGGYTWLAGHYVWRDGNWNWERGHWVQGAVRAMPPPNREDMSPPPIPGARWVPGYWDYTGNDWTWNRGHWERP
jgi:hypothetical protein